MPPLQGRQCTQDLRSIPPVTCKRHCQHGSYIQRKHPRINLYRTRIPVNNQCLNDFIVQDIHIRLMNKSLTHVFQQGPNR